MYEVMADTATLLHLPADAARPPGSPLARMEFALWVAGLDAPTRAVAAQLAATDPDVVRGQTTINAARAGADARRGHRAGSVTDDELRAYLRDYHTRFPGDSWTHASEAAARLFSGRLPPGATVKSRGKNIRRRVPDSKW